MLRTLSCALTVLLLASAPGWPQAITGSMSGSVTDKSGAAVGRAQITLNAAATGSRRTVLTNDAGEFVISSVDPGQYSLTVQAPGFKTLQRNGIQLAPSDILSVGTLTLDVGAVEEKVTVTAEGALVQTASARTIRKCHQLPNRKPARLWPGGELAGGHRTRAWWIRSAHRHATWRVVRPPTSMSWETGFR